MFLSKFFGNKKQSATKKASSPSPFMLDLLEVSGLIKSQLHKERFDHFASLTNEEWSFQEMQAEKQLVKDILDYDMRYANIIARSQPKEYWVKYFCKDIQNRCNGTSAYCWVGIDGIPYDVRIGRKDEFTFFLTFTCLDPYDMGTILEIEEEVAKLNLPFNVVLK